MAEVAGTIFGVISLSIQLFDQFSKYTNSVKDARKRAEQITRELDALVNLLENLETVISKLVTTTAIALTKTSVHECACAIESIRARLGDALPETDSRRFWCRSRNVIKRLVYPFKEGEIKYWKDVLISIQQSLQIALLASLTDQQQQYFTALQKQLSRLSLETDSGIQMILDQQRNAQTSVNRSLVYPNQSPNSSFIVSQGLYSPVQNLDNPHMQGSSAPTLLPISAIGSENEMTYLQNYTRRTQPNLLRLRRKPALSTTCTCRGIIQKHHMLQRPVLLSLERKYSHDRSCPSWLPETCAVNFSFGLILSYLIFGLKLRMLMVLSAGAGTFSLTPSLTCSRIVSESCSAAFKVIETMTSADPSKRSIQSNFAELSKVFQTRQSSPHDRLDNGQTLLHFLCHRIARSVWTFHADELEEWRKVLKLLLRYMSYEDASEIDDQGSTCVDLLLGVTDPADHRWNSLVTDLLQYDSRVSVKCHPEASFESYGSWVAISFDTFADPFFGAHDVVTSAALLRSEEDFARAVQESCTAYILEAKQTVRLYKMITRMGWVPGCKHLLDAGYDYIPPEHRTEQSCTIHDPLLFDAVESQNPEMVLFWLAVRENAKAGHLPYIGSPEIAVVYASGTCQQEGIAKILVAHLVKQRCRLREIVRDKDIQLSCLKSTNDVLDTHAICAFAAVSHQCYQVPPSLRPYPLSVYTIKGLYKEQQLVYQKSSDSVRTLQMLYDAGFRDIQRESSSCDRSTYCSPLIFAITGYRRFDPHQGTSVRFFEIVDWFLERGASLSECWPGSGTTALHCMSAKAALLTWKRPLNDYCLKKITAILQCRVLDDCKCCCSKYGCTGITSFWKGSYRFDAGYMADIHELMRPERGVRVSPSSHQRIGRWELERLIRCITISSKGIENRWIVTEFIRLFVFSLLGIRHACCNINHIEHYGEPNLERQPLPRYSLDKLERVAAEDEHLKVVLEKMVPHFDAQYSVHTNDLQSFVDDILLPQIKVELDWAKSEDKDKFDTGRRALGVAMVH